MSLRGTINEMHNQDLIKMYLWKYEGFAERFTIRTAVSIVDIGQKCSRNEEGEATANDKQPTSCRQPPSDANAACPVECFNITVFQKDILRNLFP